MKLTKLIELISKFDHLLLLSHIIHPLTMSLVTSKCSLHVSNEQLTPNTGCMKDIIQEKRKYFINITEKYLKS